MSKPGIKEALRHLVAAAEALNGKVHVDHEDDLPLIEAFRQAAVDARDALAVSAERKAKKDGQGDAGGRKRKAAASHNGHARRPAKRRRKTA